MERVMNKSAKSKLIVVLFALLACGAWTLPGQAQAQEPDASASDQILVPLARAALGQPQDAANNLETEEVIPVVAAHWTAIDEAGFWLSTVEPKMAAFGLILLGALVTRWIDRKQTNDVAAVDDSGSEINRPSYV